MSSLNVEHFLRLFPAEERELVHALLVQPQRDVSETRYERILAALETGPRMQVAPSTGKISSAAHNAMLQGLHEDLLRLFQIYGELDQAFASHERRAWSLLGELSIKLAAIEARIEQVRRWARRPDGEGMPIILDLRSSGTPDTDPERPYPVQHRMQYHESLGAMTLPVASQVDRLRSRAGGRTAQLYLLSQDGGFAVEGREGLDYVLDGRNDTAWWARHVSRSPVKDVEATGLEEGVSSTLELVFESAGPVTELMLTPFGPSGIDVLSVVCYDDRGRQAGPAWVGEDDALYAPFYADKPFALYGPRNGYENVKSIRLRIGQRHARLRDLIDENADDPLDPELRAWAEARGLMAPSNQRQASVPLLVYEYLYGIRSLEVWARTYRPRAVYVSPPITTQRPLDQLAVEVDYEPVTAYGEPASSLRLYLLVHGKQIPILPRRNGDAETRRAEMVPLTFAADGTAALPFPYRTGGTFRLYEDGERIAPALYEAYPDKVVYPQFKPGGTYWAAYDVADGPDNGMSVDIASLGIVPQEIVERFPPPVHAASDAGRVVTLSREPWIDLNKITSVDFDPNRDYRPVEVTLIGAFPDTDATRIRMEDPSRFSDPNNPDYPIVQNVTDYLSGVRRMMIPYSSGRKIYSFRQEGNRLVFADPLPHATIEVKYYTLVDSVRIAAVMERSPLAGASQTPRLRRISVHPRYPGTHLAWKGGY